MPAYVVANIDVTDVAAYEEYRRRAPPIIAQYGGRYLARGGAVEALEGELPASRIVILEFPDLAQVRRFYQSPEYQAILPHRTRHASSVLYAVEGLPPA